MEFNLILMSLVVLLVDDKTSFAYPVVLFVSFRNFTDVILVVFIESMVLKLDLNCRHFMLW
jgi:hypothetical protein